MASAVHPRSLLAVLALCAIALASQDAEAKKKKKTEPVAAKEGWVQEEGWKNACYYPPAWDKLDEITRRTMRATVLDAMVKQWGGGRDDGISFAESVVENAETTMLGRPEAVERVVVENLTLCEGVAKGQASADQWGAWVKGLPGKLTEGECNVPLDYTMFDYLEIGMGWQRTLAVCEGNKIRISGTVKDRYRVRDDGPWINVGGDTAKTTVGGEWPCNIEGCYEGMLVMKYVTQSGVETIIPVGTELIWTAPAHGEISYRINDTTFFDNIWFKSGTMTDRTAIEISPAN